MKRRVEYVLMATSENVTEICRFATTNDERKVRKKWDGETSVGNKLCRGYPTLYYKVLERVFPNRLDKWVQRWRKFNATKEGHSLYSRERFNLNVFTDAWISCCWQCSCKLTSIRCKTTCGHLRMKIFCRAQKYYSAIRVWRIYAGISEKIITIHLYNNNLFSFAFLGCVIQIEEIRYCLAEILIFSIHDQFIKKKT